MAEFNASMNDLFAQLLSMLEALSHMAAGGLDAVRGIDPSLRALVAGAAVTMGLFVITGLIVPADTVVFIAASAVASPVEAISLAGAIAIGSLLGSVTSYGLGRWVAGSAWAARWSERHAGLRIVAAHRFLMRRGGPAILGARFIPVLRMVMPFAVGMNAFPFRRFLAWTAAGSVLWAAVYVPMIALLSAPLRDKSGSLLVSLGLVVIGLIVFGAAYLVQFVIERLRGSTHTDELARRSDQTTRDEAA